MFVITVNFHEVTLSFGIKKWELNSFVIAIKFVVTMIVITEFYYIRS